MTDSWHVDAEIDFSSKNIIGTQYLNMTARIDNIDTITLDVWKLSIFGVYDSSFRSLYFKIIQPKDDIQGE